MGRMPVLTIPFILDDILIPIERGQADIDALDFWCDYDQLLVMKRERS
jgi:hypothetical protein